MGSVVLSVALLARTFGVSELRGILFFACKAVLNFLELISLRIQSSVCVGVACFLIGDIPTALGSIEEIIEVLDVNPIFRLMVAGRLILGLHLLLVDDKLAAHRERPF
jgi:hypothetical protein